MVCKHIWVSLFTQKVKVLDSKHAVGWRRILKMCLQQRELTTAVSEPACTEQQVAFRWGWGWGGGNKGGNQGFHLGAQVTQSHNVNVFRTLDCIQNVRMVSKFSQCSQLKTLLIPTWVGGLFRLRTYWKTNAWCDLYQFQNVAHIWLKSNRFNVVQAVQTVTYQSDDTRNNQIWVTRRGRVDDNQIRADWTYCVNVTLIFCLMILPNLRNVPIVNLLPCWSILH